MDDTKCDSTAHSTDSYETSEAVDTLQGCFSEIDSTGNTELEKPYLEHSDKSNTNNYENETPDSTNANSNSAMNTDTTAIPNSITNAHQVLDFDENAQYKVAGIGSSEDSIGPSDGLEFTTDIPMYDTTFPDTGIKLSESSAIPTFSDRRLISDDMNNDSNDALLLKLGDDQSVGSSGRLLDERSDVSENSLMTFPEGIMSVESGNGDASSDVDFMTKNNQIDSSSRLEDSNDMIAYASTPEGNDNNSKSNLESVEQPSALPKPAPSTTKVYTFPAENLFEYQWPQESGAEWYMLQEQISEYLTIKSFKRKYPSLKRRVPGQEEKEFLKMRGVISETQCDLGLTALRADEVQDLMMKDYPERYDQYAKVLQEKEKQNFKEKLKSYSAPKMDKTKYAAYVKKAVKSAADFNTQFQRERRDERRAYLDLQTMAIHYPAQKRKVLPPEATKPSPFPVCLMPGQFQDYYKTYTSDELKYLPLNSVRYGPPKRFTSLHDQDDPVYDDLSDDEPEDNEITTEIIPPEIEEVPEKPPPTADAPQEIKQDAGEIKCRVCEVNGKSTINEELVMCSECKAHGHPSCLDLTYEMVQTIRTYNWQCMECKTCVECTDPYDEDKMMFCDQCDRGYHTFCVGLKGLPTGRWVCPTCCNNQPKRKKPRKERSDKGVKKGPLKERQAAAARRLALSQKTQRAAATSGERITSRNDSILDSEMKASFSENSNSNSATATEFQDALLPPETR